VLRTNSVDAGEKRALRDARGERHLLVGRSRLRDARGARPLRRPLCVYVTPPKSGELLAERLVYGEAVAGGGTAENARGRRVLHYDGAGELGPLV